MMLNKLDAFARALPSTGRIALPCLLLAMTAGTPLAAQEAGQNLLQEQRWSESAYGLSLRPPKNAEPVEQSADGAVVKFAGGKATYSFYLRSAGGELSIKSGQGGGAKQQTEIQKDQDKELSLEFLRKRGQHQFTFVYPSAVLLEDESRDFEIAGREATKLYFLVSPQEEADDWVAGQAYVLIDPETVAVFQLECAAEQFEQKKAIFEAMLASARLENPKQLEQQRGQWLKAGAQWLESLSREQINGHLSDTRWFRITEQDEDVGYMRMQQRQTEELGETGFQLTIQQRVVSDDTAWDTAANFFLSYDRNFEFWELKTTRRSTNEQQNGQQEESALPQPGKPPERQSWNNTGIRTSGELTVTSNTPTRIDEETWAQLPAAYLPQAAARSLLGLLPHDQSRRFLFYAYDAKSNKLTLRRVQVDPLADGFQVRLQPAPGRGEQVWIFDEAGKLQRRRMPDGRVFHAASESELRQAWGLD